jgi:signal transduction histidine kinase
LINAERFAQIAGIPIQLVRTAAAVVIIFSLFLATHFLEQERRRELAAEQQARLEAVEQQEAMRRSLLRHTVRAQEEERARIARELHDEMAQNLTALSLDLAALQQAASPRPKTRQILARLQDLSKQMSQGIQQMVYDLRPAHLDELGLVKALQYLLDRARNTLQVDAS